MLINRAETLIRPTLIEALIKQMDPISHRITGEAELPSTEQSDIEPFRNQRLRKLAVMILYVFDYK